MNPQPTSPVVYIVVATQCLLSMICVAAICLTVFYKNYAEPSVLSALILLTGTLVGNLGSILGGPRMMMHVADTLAQKLSETKLKAEITNPTTDPIPVTPVSEEEHKGDT